MHLIGDAQGRQKAPWQRPVCDLQPGRHLGSVPLAFVVSQPGPGARGTGCRKSCYILHISIPPPRWCPPVTRTERDPLRFQAEAHMQVSGVQGTVLKVFPPCLACGPLEGGRGDNIHLSGGALTGRVMRQKEHRVDLKAGTAEFKSHFHYFLASRQYFL